jgi:hypothetical protein
MFICTYIQRTGLKSGDFENTSLLTPREMFDSGSSLLAARPE